MLTSEAKFSVCQPLVDDSSIKQIKSRTAKGDRKTPRKRLRQGIPNDDPGSFVGDEAGEIMQQHEEGEHENRETVDNAHSTGVHETLEGQKHIHPCICDLTCRQRKRIQTHLKEKAKFRRKYEHRLEEIEAELERLEEERLTKERELQEQQELFGDEYEIIGEKKKRKKRSARRASMVSLGVRQLINWKKPPTFPTKYNKTSMLRKEYTTYCGRSPVIESPTEKIDYSKDPLLRVRSTRSYQLRSEVNLQKKIELINREDKKQRFVTSCF